MVKTLKCDILKVLKYNLYKQYATRKFNNYYNIQKKKKYIEILFFNHLKV